MDTYIPHMWIIQHQTFDTLGIGFLPATDATGSRNDLASLQDLARPIELECIETCPKHWLNQLPGSVQIS